MVDGSSSSVNLKNVNERGIWVDLTAEVHVDVYFCYCEHPRYSFVETQSAVSLHSKSDSYSSELNDTL